MGRLIPAGTGVTNYAKADIETDEIEDGAEPLDQAVEA
jgi:hypothetical protein